MSYNSFIRIKVLSSTEDLPSSGNYKIGEHYVKDNKLYIAITDNKLELIEDPNNWKFGSSNINAQAILSTHLADSFYGFLRTEAPYAWTPEKLSNRIFDVNFELKNTGELENITSIGNTENKLKSINVPLGAQGKNPLVINYKNINNLNGAKFDGVDDAFISDTGITFASSTFIIFIVAKLLDVSDYSILNSSGNTPRIMLGNDSSYSHEGNFAFGIKHVSQTPVIAKGLTIAANDTIVGGVVFASNHFTMFNLGQHINTPTTFTGITTVDQYYVGGDVLNSKNYANMSIFRLMIITAPQSTSDLISRLEGWGAHRYGVAHKLPESHIYKDKPPSIYD